MKGRQFLTLLGGAAAATAPLAAQAQQPGALPRFIYVANDFPDDADARLRHTVFREAFEKLGWADGRNVRIEDHWGFVPVSRVRAVAAELVRSAPNVIMTAGSA